MDVLRVVTSPRDPWNAAGRRRWAVALAAAVLLGVVSAVLSGPVATGSLAALDVLAVLAVLVLSTAAVVAGILLVRWGEAGPVAHVAPMLGLVLLVGFERHVVPDGGSITPLAVLPVLWIALHGRRGEVLVVLVADVLVLVLPVVLVGPPQYPDGELRRAGVSALVLVVTAVVVSGLERAVRRRERGTAQVLRQVGALLDATGELLVVGTDPDGVIEVFNVGAQRSLGYRPAEVLGRPYSVLLDGPDLARAAAEHGVGTDELLQGLGAGAGLPTWTYRRKDGSTFAAEVTTSPVRSVDGGLQGYVAVAHDVTAQLSAARRLERSRDDLSLVAAAVRRVQVGEDVREELVHAARELVDARDVHLVEPADAGTLAVVRSTSARATGLTFARDSTRWHAATVWEQGERAVVADTARPPFPLPAETVQRAGGGALLWEPVFHRDRLVALLVVVWERPRPAVEDQLVLVELLCAEAGTLLELDDAKRRLVALARTDPLTGLANRRAWDDTLEVEISRTRRDGRPLVVAIADLDHFKRYNDAYGHHAGDVLLCDFARAAKEQLRTIDVMARWGGEEFVIALPDCTLEAAAGVLERVRSAVPGQETCSIGYARWDGEETSLAVVGRADRALYRAKGSGRDRALADPGGPVPPPLRVVRES